MIRTHPDSVAELTRWARTGRLGPDPDTLTTSTAFRTTYGTRHAGRTRAYRNEVLSIRVGAAVGSCGLEPGTAADDLIDDCVAATVGDLLEHRVTSVRIAALDAYLMHGHPHPNAADLPGEPVVVAGPTSLAKSRRRAHTVIDLLPAGVTKVLVVGVVGSLLAELRDRSIAYVPCDLAGGATEWGEPIFESVSAAPSDYDALLVTGMTLGNGTFDEFRAIARERALPLVLFAQTGSAVLPWFLGAGVHAVSAEPYPFFSLDGAASTLVTYRELA
ncbi:hypothetical protein [Nocardia caishijiensis]|uniref:Heavy-metal chelation domain-containing protein n=1 Tax=Nocardia caishijiensis TaxID=184756 RepID=A0ABQ6YKG3_9NOCA|nr:hypothetical protein [Nocardia caishijiensis]KAF0846065.1 hypothetical protein FNL39_106460 [Nocardia caishijiensis]